MQRKYGTISVVVFLGFIFIVWGINKCNEESLRRDGVLVKGTIEKIVSKRNSGGDVFAEYVYYVLGNRYKGDQALGCNGVGIDKVKYLLEGKPVSVIYSNSRPGNARILLKTSDYAKFKIELSFEDSLRISEFCIMCNCR